MTTRLAHQTQKAAGIGNGMRTATVAAVTTTSVTLSVNGALITSGVGVLGTYVPLVGDVVAVFRQDSSWLVLGAVGPAGMLPGASYAGTASISFASTPSNTQVVSFGITFPTPPVVVTNINTQSGSVSRWITKATLVTTTGFTLWSQSADSGSAAWSNVPVDWVATIKP